MLALHDHLYIDMPPAGEGCHLKALRRAAGVTWLQRQELKRLTRSASVSSVSRHLHIDVGLDDQDVQYIIDDSHSPSAPKNATNGRCKAYLDYVPGAGGNTKLHHIPKLQAIPGVEVVKIANRSEESAAKVCKELGVAQASTSHLASVTQLTSMHDVLEKSQQPMTAREVPEALFWACSWPLWETAMAPERFINA